MNLVCLIMVTLQGGQIVETAVEGRVIVEDAETYTITAQDYADRHAYVGSYLLVDVDRDRCIEGSLP